LNLFFQDIAVEEFKFDVKFVSRKDNKYSDTSSYIIEMYEAERKQSIFEIFRKHKEAQGPETSNVNLRFSESTNISSEDDQAMAETLNNSSGMSKLIDQTNNDNTFTLIEKPHKHTSGLFFIGMTMFRKHCFDKLKDLKPSARGELEITDVNRVYLEQRKLNVELMGRGMAWLDTGTHESLLEASQFIATLEKRQGLKVACPEEIAFRQNYINAEQLQKLAEPLKKSGYGQYLLRVLEEKAF
jgi:dTDP-glucose pyrophosphorylase